MLLSELERRDRINASKPLEPEPPGIDAFLVSNACYQESPPSSRTNQPHGWLISFAGAFDVLIQFVVFGQLVPPPPSALELIGDKLVPVAAGARQVQTEVQVRKGFDLVRVGNFAETAHGLQVANRPLPTHPPTQHPNR